MSNPTSSPYVECSLCLGQNPNALIAQKKKLLQVQLFVDIDEFKRVLEKVEL